MIRWWYFVLVVVALIVASVYAALYTLEDTFLLHPSRCLEYLAYNPVTTRRTRLSGGGLVLHCQIDPLPSSRAIMCLHGNGGNLDGMANLAQHLFQQGYDVYLLENAGYGICYQTEQGARLSPTTNSLKRDLLEGWQVIPPEKRSDAILMGFSMGGGNICQFLASDQVSLSDFPAQVALLNTYYDLPLLVNDVFPVPGVSKLMHTKWNAKAGIERFCSQHPSGLANVLVVYAQDDELIKPKHAQLIHQSVPEPHLKELVTLPNGGHNNSIEKHIQLWLPHLLPAPLLTSREKVL